MKNETFSLNLSEQGFVDGMFINDDQHKMNWVIDRHYVKAQSYKCENRLFGCFDLSVDGINYAMNDAKIKISKGDQKAVVNFYYNSFSVQLTYDLEENKNGLKWKIEIINNAENSISIDHFGVWASFAYIMFRDTDVLKNINNSAAIYPSISTDFTKISVTRRSNSGCSLGLYQVNGKTLSVGSLCDFNNLFFENVSPSLDGLIYHKMVLSDDTTKINPNDWIYNKSKVVIPANTSHKWEYIICTIDGKEDFYDKAIINGHPKFKCQPLNIIGDPTTLSLRCEIDKPFIAYSEYMIGERLVRQELVLEAGDISGEYIINATFDSLGEHKIVIDFESGKQDFVVLNVMENIENIINERVSYICNNLYDKNSLPLNHAFKPISNQGESLGKLSLVLKKNLLGELDISEVNKVEMSAVHYIKQKWFENGDFTKPIKVYGDFYRCMDFEYIAHLYYLLSKFDDSVLSIHSAKEYLHWAADVFNLRINQTLHQDKRGKEESQMLGVYFIYINDLLIDLKDKGFNEKYNELNALWREAINRISNKSIKYESAITEHYYDNAGFGPAAGALSEYGCAESAERYGNLLIANIGYSNDFRAQNPDRWWESLSYMIHSLWGGITAAATLKTYHCLNKLEYLDASYRATAGILYCYDTNSTATAKIGRGEAVSTYSVADPHINRPDLSHSRFGQATFFRNGGIFSKLFTSEDETPDWDMGEEMVAYLDGFGQNTYYYFNEDEINVINGTFKLHDDGYEIISFAPYLKNFILVDSKGIVEITQAKRGSKNIRFYK